LYSFNHIEIVQFQSHRYYTASIMQVLYRFTHTGILQFQSHMYCTVSII
jgi:hypothetical protein